MPQNWGPDPQVLYFRNRLWRGKNPCYAALKFAQVIFFGSLKMNGALWLFTEHYRIKEMVSMDTPSLTEHFLWPQRKHGTHCQHLPEHHHRIWHVDGIRKRFCLKRHSTTDISDTMYHIYAQCDVCFVTVALQCFFLTVSLQSLQYLITTGQSTLHMKSSPYTLQRAASSPDNIARSHGYLDPHLTYRSLGPPDFTGTGVAV